jgi:hypothetical protein
LVNHARLVPNHSQPGLTMHQIRSLCLVVSGSSHHSLGTEETEGNLDI